MIKKKRIWILLTLLLILLLRCNLSDVSDNSERIIIYAGSSNGHVWRSEDGSITFSQSITYIDSGVRSIAINENGKIFASGYRKVWNSTDNGKIFTQGVAYFGSTIYTIALNNQINRLYAGSLGWKYLYYSDNGGNSFSSSNAIETVQGAFLGIAINELGNIFAIEYGGTQRVWYSTDYGITIQPSITIIEGGPRSIAIDIINNIIYAGAMFDGSVGGNIWNSTDNGKIFIKSNNNVNGNVLAICIDKDGKIYIGSSNNHVWYSINSGIDFSQSNTDLNGMVYSIDIDKNGKIYAGSTDGHIWYSMDGGITFTSSDTVLGGTVYSIAIDYQ